MRTGREPEFANSEAGLKRFIELSDSYIELVKDAGTVPTIEEWCACIDITRRTLYSYEKRPLFEPVIKAYKYQIRTIRNEMYYGLNSSIRLSAEQKRELIERGALV